MTCGTPTTKRRAAGAPQSLTSIILRAHAGRCSDRFAGSTESDPARHGQGHPTFHHRRAQSESWRVLGLRMCGIAGLTRRRPVGKTVATPRIGGEPSRAVSVGCSCRHGTASLTRLHRLPSMRTTGSATCRSSQPELSPRGADTRRTARARRRDGTASRPRTPAAAAARRVARQDRPRPHQGRRRHHEARQPGEANPLQVGVDLGVAFRHPPRRRGRAAAGRRPAWPAAHRHDSLRASPAPRATTDAS